MALHHAGCLVVFTPDDAGFVPEKRGINLRSPHLEETAKGSKGIVLVGVKHVYVVILIDDIHHRWNMRS